MDKDENKPDKLGHPLDFGEIFDPEDIAAMSAPRDEKPWAARELVDQLADRFHLGRRTREELEGLVELLRHRRDGELAHPVRYGLLIQCDSDDYARQFVEELSQLLIPLGLLDGPADFSKEGERTVPHRGNLTLLRVVLGCTQAPEVNKVDAVSAQERARQALKAWEEFWNREEFILRKIPSLIGVAVVSKTVVRSCWQKRDSLFYRVYGHHIFLDDLPPEDIWEQVCGELGALGLELDDPFKQALHDYVRTVYPKADLKLRPFVEDLVNRILTTYYSVPCPEEKLTPRCVPYYRQSGNFEEIISKLDSLVGMGPAREALQEIYYQNRQPRERGRTPLRLNMVFVGNPGTGKTTVARMMADMLCSMGLIRKNKLVVAKPSDLISPWVGQTAIQTRDVCRSAYDGVLFIDEAYALTFSPEHYAGGGSSTPQCVNALLQEMEENADRLVVIFAGYPDLMDHFLDSNAGLRSRVTRIVRFPDYTEEELLQIFEAVCKKERFTVAEDGYEALRACIAFEKSGENFGNARSVENIFQRVRAEWQKGQGTQRVLTREHIQAIMPEQQRSEIVEMIGLDDIKAQLKQFESRVQYIKTVGEKGVRVPPMNLHMMFTGSPGTGKTTVARMIAEDLYRIGVLKTNKCICVEARDLIGNWSDAAQRTEKEIQRAMGGVLFLDEAYALTEYASRNVGREVVATLITAMEKYRGELLVIVAGYPNNMRAFLSANRGLASRIGHTFHFRDYTVQELTDIFLSKMQRYGYLLSDGVADRVKQLMEYFHVIPDFGNGRFVDNVIDQTITLRSMRGADDLCRYNEITADDIPDVKTLLDSLPDGDRFWDPAKVTQEERRRTAVHEMGHALVSLLLEPETELCTVSITDQAFSGGRVGFQRSGGNLTEEQMMNTISIALGGRGAERVVFGSHTTGCASDYAKAKAIAKDMLEHYAMGPELGASDIAPLLKQANDTVMELLGKHKNVLLALADQLLEQRELTDEYLRRYLAEHPVEE